MNKHILLSGELFKATIIVLLIVSCKQDPKKNNEPTNEVSKSEKAEYFLLRPELEKMYGYTQAVRVGNLVKIGGVISIDDKGSPIAKGDYLQQMKNCYASLDKVLKHYGCTFDDVILENIYTTSMAELQKMLPTDTRFIKIIFLPAVGLASKNLDYPK